MDGSTTLALPAADHGGAPAPRKRLWRWVLLTLLALFLVDVLRPPQHQVSARVLVGAIDLYQATLSPWMPAAGVHCRFTPTCSHYGEAALKKHGVLKGTWLTGWRLLRCGPWTPQGTVELP